MNRIANEFAKSVLKVMGLNEDVFVESAIVEKLKGLRPQHYGEIMISLMDNQERYSKPIEKISTAIQKTLDRYIFPQTPEEMTSFLKRNFKGRIISDNMKNVFHRGVRIALGTDGEKLTNLYNGEELSMAECIEVTEWCLNNIDKLGIVEGHFYSPEQIEHKTERILMIQHEYFTPINDEIQQLAEKTHIKNSMS